MRRKWKEESDEESCAQNARANNIFHSTKKMKNEKEELSKNSSNETENKNQELEHSLGDDNRDIVEITPVDGSELDDDVDDRTEDDDVIAEFESGEMILNSGENTGKMKEEPPEEIIKPSVDNLDDNDEIYEAIGIMSIASMNDDSQRQQSSSNETPLLPIKSDARIVNSVNEIIRVSSNDKHSTIRNERPSIPSISEQVPPLPSSPPPSNMNNNSLYAQSKEQLLFTRAASEYSEGYGEMIDFWKRTLLAIMSPYAVLGVPVFGIYKLSGQYSTVDKSKTYLKYLFRDLTSTTINGAEVFFCLLLNLYVISWFLAPLTTMQEDPELTEHLMSLGAHMLEISALILAVNLIWFKGYRVSNIVQTLDNKIQLHDDLNTNHSRTRFVALPILQFGALFTGTVSSLISFELKQNNTFAAPVRMRSEFYYLTVARFFLFLMIPSYIVLISGIFQRTSSLNVLLQRMADGNAPVDNEEFRRIKIVFKQNADIICTVNRTCNFIVSDILIVLIINIFKEVFAFGMSLSALDTHIQINIDSNQLNNNHGLAMMIFSVLFDSLEIGTKGFLLISTFARVTSTNRQMFATQNNLQELASLYIDRPNEIYQSFILMKSYIKARIGRRQRRPALLKLIAAKWIPCTSLGRK